MEDRLKKYVADHRAELERYQPREHLWKEIDDRMQQHRRAMLWRTTAIAASVLLMISCCAWIFVAKRDTSRPVTTTIREQPQINAAETYCTAIMQIKDAAMEQYCRPQPELCRDFEKDMTGLNEAYGQLKKEYMVSADKKTIMQAMMNNLRMQVQLISRQLQIMETIAQKKQQTQII